MAGATLPILDSENLQTGTGRLSVDANASAFGGLQAQAGQRLAGALDQVAQVAAAKDEEFNQANALDLDNQLSARIRDRLHNPQTGYLTTALGRNAIDQQGQTEADLDEMANQLAPQARSPQAAALFRRVAQQRVDSALGQVASHAEQQTASYLNAQSEARISEATDNAVAAFGDDAQVASNVALAQSEIQTVGRRLGMDDDWINNRVRAVQSDIYGRVIGQLATTDPTHAQAMFDQIRPHLSAQEAGELQTTMRVAQREFVDNIEGQGWQAFANNQPLASIGADAYREMTTNPLLGAAHARLVEAYRTRAQSYASHASIRNDSPAYIAAQLAASANPQLFLTPGALEDYLATNAGAISPSDMVSLIELRRKMQTDAQDVQSQQSSFNALLGPSQAALAPFGIDLTVSDSAAARNNQGRQALARANAFRASLMRANQQFFQTHARAPAGDEVQHVIGQAILGMHASDVQNLPSFARPMFSNQPQSNALMANRPGIQRGAVAPTGETVVPIEAIPQNDHVRIATGLYQLLGRQPTVGEVQNYYGAELQGVAAPIDPRALKPQQLERIIAGLRTRLGHEPTDQDIQSAISQIIAWGR